MVDRYSIEQKVRQLENTDAMIQREQEHQRWERDFFLLAFACMATPDSLAKLRARLPEVAVATKNRGQPPEHQAQSVEHAAFLTEQIAWLAANTAKADPDVRGSGE